MLVPPPTRIAIRTPVLRSRQIASPRDVEKSPKAQKGLASLSKESIVDARGRGTARVMTPSRRFYRMNRDVGLPSCGLPRGALLRFAPTRSALAQLTIGEAYLALAMEWPLSAVESLHAPKTNGKAERFIRTSS
jgi:hypothetical protein